MRIIIENLPPIASGSFELRPLTIFIGPNNTGKSRAGQLAWAFARQLDRAFVSSAFSRGSGVLSGDPIPEFDESRIDEIFRADFANHVASINGSLSDTLDALLGFDFDWANGTVAFQGEHGARFSYVFGSAGSELHSNFSDVIPRRPGWQSILDGAERTAHSQRSRGSALDAQIWQFIREEYRFPAGSAYCLPAGRGAFASTWAFYARLALQGSGAAGQYFNLPTVAAAFLSELLDAAAGLAAGRFGNNRVMMAVDLLEQELIEGRVTVAGSPSIPYPLVYSNDFAQEDQRFTIELSKASSSVNELGPLAMILKALVRPGDVVVIDEPEAHLHPENHRLIAHVLVRLANAGVTVVAPTHSSTIVHQISNLVRASGLEFDGLGKLGLDPYDVIDPGKVGIYEFKRKPQGVAINEIAFNADYGYGESEFFDVAMELNNETANIDVELPKAS